MTTTWRSRLRSLSTLPADTIELGRFVGIFGIRGELRMHLENRESELLSEGLDVFLRDDAGHVFKAFVRIRPGTNGRILATVRGIDVRELAEPMLGVSVHVGRGVLPQLKEGEYYLSDLVGMSVRCGERDLGRVVAVYDSGPVEVLELDGGRYLPSTAEHILSIDLEQKVVFVAEGAVAV